MTRSMVEFQRILSLGYGDGQDTIIENDLWDDYFFDKIRFKEGVDPDDVR